MSDLREKISDLLDEWRSEINEEATAYDWGCWAKTPDSPYEVADRIIALLPKVPELRWDDDDNLMLGNLYTGDVRENWGDNRWSGYTSEVVISSATKQKAIAAVEAAVRKALGWEA